jgi:LacI family transcriptional regulator
LVDNYVGSVAAIEHLIRLGHQRIAFIGGDPNYHPNAASRLVEEQRLSGYRDTLKLHGLPIDDALIVLGEYYSLEDGGFAGDGHAYARRLLEMRPRPTAIFAACDIVAAGVLQATYEYSLRVPDDVSLVGFDDTYAPHLSPPLTTVEQPMLGIGRAAARIMVRLAEGDHDNGQSQIETLSTRLVVRASTGPPPAAGG